MYPVPVTSVVARLGGERTLGSRVRRLPELEEAVDRGLPKRVVPELMNWLSGSAAERRELRSLVVAEATYKRSARLPAAASERAERLARVMALAERALGSADEARAWLIEPHPLFAGKRPVEVARTDIGARRVERTLLNIEHGLPV
jgi:putative toxin-antitoxin system antitoxin component (TIGR02293 family)